MSEVVARDAGAAFKLKAIYGVMGVAPPERRACDYAARVWGGEYGCEDCAGTMALCVPIVSMGAVFRGRWAWVAGDGEVVVRRLNARWSGLI